MLPEYLFDVSNKANLLSEDLQVFENFTLASKSQTFLYSEVFYQPAPGYKKSFYICRRSDEKCKYSFIVTLFRLGFFQLNLRQLVFPDLETWFIARSQLGPSIQSGSSPCSGLQVVTQSTHLLKDCYLQLVLNPLSVENSFNQKKKKKQIKQTQTLQACCYQHQLMISITSQS